MINESNDTSANTEANPALKMARTRAASKKQTNKGQRNRGLKPPSKPAPILSVDAQNALTEETLRNFVAIANKNERRQQRDDDAVSVQSNQSNALGDTVEVLMQSIDACRSGQDDTTGSSIEDILQRVQPEPARITELRAAVERIKQSYNQCLQEPAFVEAKNDCPAVDAFLQAVRDAMYGSARLINAQVGIDMTPYDEFIDRFMAAKETAAAAAGKRAEKRRKLATGKSADDDSSQDDDNSQDGESSQDGDSKDGKGKEAADEDKNNDSSSEHSAERLSQELGDSPPKKGVRFQKNAGKGSAAEGAGSGSAQRKRCRP